MSSPVASPARPLPALGIGWRQPHYEAVLTQRPALAFIEVHSENFFAPGGAALSVLREGRALYPVSLHGVGLALGSACGIDAWHLDRLEQLVRAIEPVRVSDHAAFARAALNGSTVHAGDLLPVPFSDDALRVMCENVQRVQDRLRRPLAVENLSAYVRWEQADMDEPAFLNALARRTGCQLLVDVNNVMVNTLNALRRDGCGDPLAEGRRWIEAIDPRHVAELHLAGHADVGDIVIDDHGSRVSDPTWALYRHALRHLGPVPTLIEWDTDIPPLQTLLQEADRAREQALLEVAS